MRGRPSGCSASGFNVIGVDICRTVPRNRHHAHRLLQAAPGRRRRRKPAVRLDQCADAILAYESFHHIPDRRRAMASYDRVLRDGGTVILAEPGGEHEGAKVSVDAMEKFGILERGMELDDVAGYAGATTFGRARAGVPAACRYRLSLESALDDAFFEAALGLRGQSLQARQGRRRAVSRAARTP